MIPAAVLFLTLALAGTGTTFAGPADAMTALAGPGVQTPADSTAVIEAALDYIEGWFEGDGERMGRALHPDLVKRIVRDGRILQQSTADLTGMAQRRGPDAEPASMREHVTILDMTDRSAVVRIDAPQWIDFMHLARFEDGWKIVNVLWETR